MDCYPYPNQRSPLKEIREEGLFHCDPLDEGESVEAEAESGQPSNKCSLPDLVTTSMAASIQQPRNLFDSVVLLDHLPESSGDDDDGDHLFLLPDRVLAMDSISFREDVAAIAPSFLPQQHSPHNSLDSSDSNRSLRLADDSEGLRLARASNGCRTLWLCEAGLIGQTSSNSSSGHLLVDDSPTLTSNKSVPVHEDDIHSQSPTSSPPPPHQLHHHQQQQYHPQQQQQQQVSSQKNEESPPSNSHPQPQPHHLDEDVDLDHSGQSRDDVNTPSSKRPLSRKSSTHRNQTSDLWFMFDSDEQFGGEGRDQLSLSTKEREDRVRKIKEHQEEERRKKLEELKQHAQASQKFREQQEFERRRHFELLRSKENEKLSAVVERRKAIESADRERKEALLKKAIEREEKIMEKRREQQARMTFAFGSSTPRSLHPNLGSSSDIWGSSRSNGQGNIMSQSMYSPGPTANRKSAERELMDESMKKRTSSVHGLDKSGDGRPRLSTWKDRSSAVNRSSPSRFLPNLKSIMASPASGAASAKNTSNTNLKGVGTTAGLLYRKDRFTKVQSQPGSPMAEQSPLYWFIRDIDIGDSHSERSSNRRAPSADGRGPRPPGPSPCSRSRHDSHFMRGSASLVGGEDSGLGLPSSSMSQSFCLSGTGGTFTAHRRRTDLMPTITPGMMARESGSSRSSTPAGTKRSTPGRAVSMSRLDQLSRPRLHANHSPSHTRHMAKGTSKTSLPNQHQHHHHQQQQQPGSSHYVDVVFRQGMSASVSMGHLNRPPSNSANHINHRSPVKRRSSQLAKRPPRPRPEGISRESSSVHQSRPPSAMSSDSNTNTNGGVRMRRSHVRRARPISIATTGMSTSMIETRRSTPSRTNQKSLTSSTRMTRSKSIDKDDDNNSTKSTNSLSKSPSSNAVGGTPRRTPAQVKADSNAKKGKTPVKAPSTPMKSPVGKKDFVSSSTSIEERPPKSTTPDLTPKFQTEEVTPDVISGGAIGEGQKSPVKDKSPPPSTADGGQENTADSGPGTPSKKIISSEEEAKAKLAEKRRQMKEKMEREAELERQRLAEEERLEEERRLKEEEEERLAMIEADRLAALARQAEEERLQKAMEEAQKREEEERQRKEEEEKAKKEKEEAERKAREEAEMKQKEMEEKHRKEEAERLERKKRIEQIMARTRGSKGTPTSTPKKEAAAAPDTKSDDLNGTIVNPAESDNENAYQSTSDPRDQTQHHSANADDMSGEQSSSTASATPQPDLLGDLFSNNNKEQSNTLASPTAPSSVFAENEKNQAQDASPNKQLLLDSPEEKGTIDTQIKEVSASNSNGQSHGNGNHEFDQILDLNEAKESSASEVTTAPIIAFENETTNGGQESGAASPLNKLDANTAGMAFIA
ncbi:zinc finger CCCH domain-containing protein 13-like isoform X3 [Tigriopus californicus]|uniref:zinc finger CCCH domain-containing protein 13-like isoform X3 n=1 Tax=Tigriopus californicus TaxID=6832 RepID=UPI0027DA7B81|nr:zinc finger CCCH domain-containing protein 13-like isoform X3 [Tigriopus californicus]